MLIFLTRLHEKVISGFLLFSFFLKSGWILLLQSCYPAIPGYLMGCTYLDFEQYIADHPDCSVVEMDIVEGPDGL